MSIVNAEQGLASMQAISRQHCSYDYKHKVGYTTQVGELGGTFSFHIQAETVAIVCIVLYFHLFPNMSQKTFTVYDTFMQKVRVETQIKKTRGQQRNAKVYIKRNRFISSHIRVRK